MKYIRSFLFLLFFLSSCLRPKIEDDYSNVYPPYKIVYLFSKKNEANMGLKLVSYGINHDIPKGYGFDNEVYDYSLTFKLIKESMTDEVYLEEARGLIVSVAESFIDAVNTDPEVMSLLCDYPLTINRLRIFIHFTDPKQIDLGQGVAAIHFSHGKIKYERYKIEVYTDRYPAIGRHYLMHEETYDEALKIVKGVEKKELQGD